jgi:divalent metal cation (Fe/Co/Zn/Cd) transporter
VSACVAGAEAIVRLINPQTPDHLFVLASAGLIGCLGNLIAARIRTRAGHRLHSPALVADGNHARSDAYVSLAVVASAAAVAAGAAVADPLIAIDHARDSADHLAVVADSPRSRPCALAALGLCNHGY